MADKPIAVGDLVMVVRPFPCCGQTSYISQLHKVEALEMAYFECPCGQKLLLPMAITGNWHGFPISILIRIDPPALPESIHTEEKVSA